MLMSTVSNDLNEGSGNNPNFGDPQISSPWQMRLLPLSGAAAQYPRVTTNTFHVTCRERQLLFFKRSRASFINRFILLLYNLSSRQQGSKDGRHQQGKCPGYIVSSRGGHKWPSRGIRKICEALRNRSSPSSPGPRHSGRKRLALLQHAQ